MKGEAPRTRTGQARIVFLVVVLLALLGLSALGGESKPATIEVRLPADAELELNGNKTGSTGEVRRFESPSLETGRTSTCTLKATWRGQGITRNVTPQPGRTAVVDLRKELEAALPAGSIRLRMPPVITLEAGEQALLAVHVQADNLNEPVTLSFSGLPNRVQIGPAKNGGAQEGTWRGVATAAADAEATSATVKVLARSGKARAELPFELVVTRAQAVASKSRAPKSDKPPTALRERRVLKEKQRARLTVHAPVDADLEVDGAKVRRTAETCQLEYPPLEVDATFSCALKVSWHGLTKTQQLIIRPGQEVTVDLCRELGGQKPATPPEIKLIDGTPGRCPPATVPPAPATLEIIAVQPGNAGEGPTLTAVTPERAVPPASTRPGGQGSFAPSSSETLPLPPPLAVAVASASMPVQEPVAQPAPLPVGPAQDKELREAAPAQPAEAVQAPEVLPVFPIALPSKPSETLAATAAVPDRWLLMKALQGTWLGTVLDTERISLYGWTQMNYTASSVQDNQLPMGMNYLANQFELEQNWLRFERPVVTSGTSVPTFGFRFDTILPGTDSRFTLPRGLWSSQLIANDGQPSTYGIDPAQFYGEACFPTIGTGLHVKVGRMVAQFGVETLDAPPNALASHSYTFFYDPFTNTGVIATLQLTPIWSVQLGGVIGPDVWIDPAASPYLAASVKWAPPTARDSILLSTLFGSGQFNEAEQFNNPNIFDLVYVHTFSSRLTYTLEALFGYQTNVPDIGTATWFSTVHYLTWKFTPRLSGTARLELFDDIDGNRTGFAGLYAVVTAGLNFQPQKDIIFRQEVRYDYNDESRPFQGNHGLFTATVDVIVRW
jgi:uncharacterized protein (TIGR03000 family)